MFDLLQHLLRRIPGGLLDVGANLGQTLVKYRAAEPERPYVGFEPNPFCTHYLRELNRVNRFNAQFIPVGLGDRTDLIRFSSFSDSPADPMATTVPKFRGG
jgi:FkbM family methyltransferase